MRPADKLCWKYAQLAIVGKFMALLIMGQYQMWLSFDILNMYSKCILNRNERAQRPLFKSLLFVCKWAYYKFHFQIRINEIENR